MLVIFALHDSNKKTSIACYYVFKDALQFEGNIL